MAKIYGSSDDKFGLNPKELADIIQDFDITYEPLCLTRLTSNFYGRVIFLVDNEESAVKKTKVRRGDEVRNHFLLRVKNYSRFSRKFPSARIACQKNEVKAIDMSQEDYTKMIKSGDLKPMDAAYGW